MHDDHDPHVSLGGHGLPTAPEHLDPVCGMTIDPSARPELQLEHLGRSYYFCSKGCFLDFQEDPGKFLDPGYLPREM